MFGMSLVIFLSFGSLPLFWPIPESGNVHAATTVPSTIPNTGNSDSTAALNSYLQSQQQKAAEQKQQQAAQTQQAAATTNNAQNTKLVWPWWVKVFSGAMVINSILAFFTFTFGLAALWKWLALKK